MGVLDQKPSEIINPRKWSNFLQIRVKLINAFKERDFENFIVQTKLIKKISRGILLEKLTTLLNTVESEYKHIKILQELTLDKKELVAILKK